MFILDSGLNIFLEKFNITYDHLVYNKDENVHRFVLRGDIFLFYDIYTGYLLSIVEREWERERENNK